MWQEFQARSVLGPGKVLTCSSFSKGVDGWHENVQFGICRKLLLLMCQSSFDLSYVPKTAKIEDFEYLSRNVETNFDRAFDMVISCTSS